MPLTGDFGALERWEKQFGSLASPGLAQEVSRSMAAESVRRVEQGFEKQRDPFGNPWKSKAEPDGRKILRGKTGRLSQWKQLSAGADGFQIASRHPEVFDFHQRGTGRHGAGRGPYKITPKREGGVLAFRSGGRMRFARSVMHEGVPVRRMVPGSRLPALWASKYREIYQRNVRKRLR